MKRMLNTVIVAFICSMLVGNMPSLAYSDIEQVELKNVVAQLSEFNIINGYPDGTFRPWGLITRAEFAKMIVVATNNENEFNGSASFDDVAPSHWATQYIATAQYLGIINGATPTVFKPNANVNYEQAIKMIISALGYDEDARLAGGYPAGYIAVANQLNLLSDNSIDYKEAATRSDISLILAKTITAPYYELSNVDGAIHRVKSSGMLQSLLASNTSLLNVQAISQVGYVYNTDNLGLRLREEPNLRSATLAIIPEETQVTIVGDQKVGQFYNVEWNGNKGWSSSDYITLTAPSALSTPINPLEPFEQFEPFVSSSPSASSTTSLPNIRSIAPDTNNEHYYSNLNIFYAIQYSPPFYDKDMPILGNCTWYAWGRAYEILGENPGGFLKGNAHTWWQSNKDNGKYKYGSVAKPGAIAVWDKNGAGGYGHLAIVEKIEDGKVYISESYWRDVKFKYNEIHNTDNLLGYIYILEPN